MDLAIHLSLKPVTLKDNPNELAPHVVDALKKLVIAGKKPIEELRECRWYLGRKIREIQDTCSKKSWKVRNGNPRRVGTLAYYEYLDDNTAKIIGILTAKMLDKSFRWFR